MIIKIWRLILILCFTFTTQFLYSQVNKVPNLKLYDYEPYHFGFILAANQMDFIVKQKSDIFNRIYTGKQLPEFDIGIANVDSAKVYGITSLPAYGFTVGIVGDRRIGNYFDLRFIPSLAFGTRTLSYTTRLFVKSDSSTKVLNQKVNSTFVEFPLFLKFKTERVHNIRMYVIGGIKYNIDLASQANKTEQDNYEPKLFRTDTYFILGSGIDIYMNWFKFGIELTMSYGMRDMLLRENNLYTEGIESLRSKLFMFTFTFE